MLDNNYREVVSDKGDYSDVRRTDIAMPVRRWLSGERDIKSLISNFDKSFTKLGIENNIRKYEPPKPEPDPSILGTDDEKVTQPATTGIEPDNQGADSRETGFSGSNKLPGDQGADSRETGFSGSNKLPAKISSAAVRKPGDYEEFDASPDPRNRNPKTFRSASPTYTPIQSTSKYEPEDTDYLDTGSTRPVNYSKQDIERLSRLARAGKAATYAEPKPKKISTAVINTPSSKQAMSLGNNKQPTTRGVSSNVLNTPSSRQAMGLGNNKQPTTRGLTKGANSSFPNMSNSGTNTFLNLDKNDYKIAPFDREQALKKIPKGNKKDFI